jgi:hypothetical protein
MGVALARKNDGGDDPRDALRSAIVACTAGQLKTDRQLDAIRRAKDLVATAERRVSEVAESLESIRGQGAEDLAAALQAGSTPKSNATLRAAKASLGDRTDELEAAKAALDRLEADGDVLDASSPQLENLVLVAISQVVAAIAERLLTQMRQKQVELLILQQVFHALTEDETVGLPLFDRDVQRLNAKDARMKPVAQLRGEFFALSIEAGQDRAREVAGAFRKWRTALCRDPDAAAPEL